MALGPRQTRARRWTPAAIPMGILLMALGAWTAVVPLVGPYFDFGFFTDSAWSFSARHWELLLLPGAVIFVGGLLLTMPRTGLGWLGGLLAVVGGAWLLVGPALYPLWTTSDGIAVGTQQGELMTALLWVGYFLGSGGLTLWLAGFGKGLISRRPVVEDHTVIEETPVPVEQHDRVVTNA